MAMATKEGKEVSTETEIRRGKALRLSTTETAGAIDTGSIVLMSADEARAAASEIKARLGDLRRTIHEFDTREGWRALGHDSFRAWAIAEIDQVSIRQVYRLLAAAEVESNLGVTIGHTPESHLRPLASLEPDQQREVWQLASELAGDEPRQAAHVAAAVEQITGPKCFDCGTTESVVEVGGGAKHLCRTCQIKRGVRLTEGLSDEAIRRGYSYRESGGSVAIEKAGMFIAWVYQDGARAMSLEEHIQRSIDLIESRVANELPSSGQVDRQRSLIERAAAAGLEMTVSDKKISFSLPDGTPYGGAKNLDEAESRIRLREGANAKRLENRESQQLACSRCGQTGSILYGSRCQGCYHLYRASQGKPTEGMLRFHLSEARRHAVSVSDPDVAAGLLAEIADIESAHPPVALPVPAPAPAPAEIESTPEPEINRDVLHQHAESTLAGLLQKLEPTELRLLHCLVVGVEDLWPGDEGVAEEIWEFAGQQLAEMRGEDLRWIEAGL